MMRAGSIALASVLLGSTLAAQRTPVDEAWDLLAKDRRSEAVSVLERILKGNPRDAEAHLMLGSIFAEDGRLEESAAHLKEAVRLRPQSPESHQALGETYRKAGDKRAAQQEFEKAVTLNPKFAQAHADLGLSLLEAGNPANAARHLDLAIQIMGNSPDSAYPRYLRAKVYSEQNAVEPAAAQLKSAVALRPDFAEAWSDLGQARRMMNDEAGALAAFQRSIEADPENAVAQYRLGAEYLRQAKPHEAIAPLEAAYRLNPKDQSTLYSLQMALRQDGKAAEAAAIKRKLSDLLLEIDRESQAAFQALRLNNEGAALEKAGDLRGAATKYQEAVALDPAHPGFRVNLGTALLRLGQWKPGIAELREALKRDPVNATIQAALEDALRQAPSETRGNTKPRP